MIKVSKIVLDRGLQKLRPQTIQYIPDKPFIGNFRVLGKCVDNDGKVKEYRLKRAEQKQVNDYLASEERDINARFRGC